MNGADIVTRIDVLLKANGVSRGMMAKVVGISPNTISAWKTRGTIPDADVACQIAHFLGVSIEYLLYGSESRSIERKNYSSDVREIADMLELLDPRDRKAVKLMTQTLLNNDDVSSRFCAKNE